MARTQFDFKGGMRTKDVFICSIDYVKSFDGVQYDKLIAILGN